MNMKIIDQIIKSNGGQLYYGRGEVGELLGLSRYAAYKFLDDNRVPYYLVGKTKKYFLPEILETVEKSRYRRAVV